MENPMIEDIKKLEAWFATGSQHLYGPETLEQVAQDHLLAGDPGFPRCE